jgi:hypothetical protein
VGLFVVGEVDLAEAETLSTGEIPAHLDARDFVIALKLIYQLFFTDVLV